MLVCPVFAGPSWLLLTLSLIWRVIVIKASSTFCADLAEVSRNEIPKQKMSNCQLKYFYQGSQRTLWLLVDQLLSFQPNRPCFQRAIYSRIGKHIYRFLRAIV
jgi:hypothetical protein